MADPLTIIGAVSSVASLISEAITLVQKIKSAKAAIASGGNTIIEQNTNLESLLQYLQLLEEEEALQTASVADSVQDIIGIGNELQKYLDDMTVGQSKSKGRQFFHNLKSGDKDAKDLEDILKKLDRARIDLAMRIQLVNVGVTRSVRDGLVAAMPLVRRTNRNVERVLDSGLKIAELLKAREDQVKADGTITLLAADIEALGLGPKQTEQGEMVWVGNMSLNQAKQVNGNLGELNWQSTAKMRWESNVAKDSSRQVNGNMSGEEAAKFWASS